MSKSEQKDVEQGCISSARSQGTHDAITSTNVNEESSELTTPLKTEHATSESTKRQESTISKKSVKTVQIKEPPVADIGGGYSVVKIEEKHGMFHNAIPVMPLPIAVILCLLNIFAPGVGTLLSSPFSFCCTTRLSNNFKAFAVNVLSALLQMVTFLVIVGWIWSILWGMTMVQLSLQSSRKAKTVNVPYYVRRQSSVESQGK